MKEGEDLDVHVDELRERCVTTGDMEIRGTQSAMNTSGSYFPLPTPSTRFHGWFV